LRRPFLRAGSAGEALPRPDLGRDNEGAPGAFRRVGSISARPTGSGFRRNLFDSQRGDSFPRPRNFTNRQSHQGCVVLFVAALLSPEEEIHTEETGAMRRLEAIGAKEQKRWASASNAGNERARARAAKAYFQLTDH
jgi:hypothetical protein